MKLFTSFTLYITYYFLTRSDIIVKSTNANAYANSVNVKNYIESTTRSVFPSFCGKRPLHRIVGGRAVTPQLWPWFVRLKSTWAPPFCGGAFITSRHVLTASHCLRSFTSRHFLQYLKISPAVYENFKPPDNRYLFDAIEIINHPKFGDGGHFYNDVSIIVTSPMFLFNIPICLPLNQNIPYLWRKFFLNEMNATSISHNIGEINDTDKINIKDKKTDFATMSPNENSTLPKNESQSLIGEVSSTFSYTDLYTVRQDTYNSLHGDTMNKGTTMKLEISENELYETPSQLTSPIIKEIKTPLPLDQTTEHDNKFHDAIVIGYGRLKEFGRVSQYLQEAYIGILNHSLCENAYGKEYNKEIMLCAGSIGGGVDACQGDSGGPLMKNFQEGWVQIGVVSFGTGCGNPSFPGVYTNISRYLEWIESVIANTIKI